MKRNLIAAALLSGFAGAALAAPSVTLYGLIDTSLSYVHTHSDVKGVDSTDTFSMENGQEFGSRWGLRGTERFDSGVTVGFTLESGFESDTGLSDTKQNDRLFGREASLSVSGRYGTLWAGRLPIFGSVLGANGLFRAIDPIFANYTSGLGSGFATASSWTRVDNALSYRSPTFAGFTGYAMYSFKNDAKVNTAYAENKAAVDRYGSLAVRYKGDNLEAVLVADTTLWGNATYGHADDGWTVTLGGNYKFSNGLKLIAFGQYFDKMFHNANARAGVVRSGLMAFTNNAGYGQVDGWGASLGVNYPLFGGTVKFAVNYRDMDNQTGYDFNRWTVAGAYDYELSKRTSLYALAGFSQEKIKKNGESVKPNGCQATVGLLHRF
ncbi:porin [Mesosutterella sp. AGMB02718]|uniref:Porin n=1 Tax=Mesosutterella faecium TaxID=2925194 RepID=A0ABT7IPJ6_9BURK|nr:porin [Mesosutterella sp. AGMB02718]MDL2060320.1 porin [Mesosutterella sp. AGMB02718]